MIASEAAQVLTVAAAYDGRSVTEEAAIAWAAALERVQIEDAMQAVKAHYRTSRKWMMPADVVEASNRAQQTRELEQTRSLSHRDRSERACNTPGCACTHTACFKGWIDKDVTFERHGQTYISADRCPKCRDYAEANAVDKQNGWSR